MLVEFGELKHGAPSEILRKEAIQLGPQHTAVRSWTVSLTQSFTNASDIMFLSHAGHGYQDLQPHGEGDQQRGASPIT